MARTRYTASSVGGGVPYSPAQAGCPIGVSGAINYDACWWFHDQYRAGHYYIMNTTTSSIVSACSDTSASVSSTDTVLQVYQHYANTLDTFQEANASGVSQGETVVHYAFDCSGNSVSGLGVSGSFWTSVHGKTTKLATTSGVDECSSVPNAIARTTGAFKYDTYNPYLGGADPNDETLFYSFLDENAVQIKNKLGLGDSWDPNLKNW